VSVAMDNLMPIGEFAAGARLSPLLPAGAAAHCDVARPAAARGLAGEFVERRRVLHYVKRILKEEPMYDVLTKHVPELAYVSRTKHVLVPELEPFIVDTFA
jgi:hypothetical protein